MLYFSATTGGFYNPAVHSGIPADAVEVTADQHAGLLDGQARGQVIGVDRDGFPVLQDPPALSADEIAKSRCVEIQRELAAIDAASARPLRAIVAGSADDADRERIAELDQQATRLRAELAAFG